MSAITRAYIDGRFVETPAGHEHPLFNPATEQQIGSVRLADQAMTEAAVAAAKRAEPIMAALSVEARIALLKALQTAVAARAEDLASAMIAEYGAPARFARQTINFAAQVFADTAKSLEAYRFRRRIGASDVIMTPVGVTAAITPWNSNTGFICSKLAPALATGCPVVCKPSEMSATQTDVLLDAIHSAGLPRGAFNLINGSGQTVGAALISHRDIAKVTFTGSTRTGEAIVRASAQTMKRLTLELGGKGANIILDDADLAVAAPTAIRMGLTNSGQACHAGTRILAPAHRYDEVVESLVAALEAMKVGDPADEATAIGPMVSAAQFERVQGYIRLGLQEGATAAFGGEGRPAGLDKGWFVQPTLLVGVDNDMRVAREEIFGPVLCVIPYADDAEAVAIGNDSPYGLQAYVHGADPARTRTIAEQLRYGRVIVNGAPADSASPFGGFKHSGLGREFGAFGLDAFLEPRVISAA